MNPTNGLSVPIDEPTWQSSDELAASLRESLALDLREVFDYLWSGTRTVWREIPVVGSGTEAESPAVGDSSMSYPVREPHIDTLLEGPFTRLLSEEQRAAYEAAKAARGQNEPRLRLDTIQRYILWRVFDLGWTAERFGELDSLINRSASYATDSRGSRKSERIGKKYQWIAYHEILAHISDHYQYRAMYDDKGPKNAYKGTWQLSIRDIDPSTTVRATPSNHGRSDLSATWWRHHAVVTPVEEVNHQDWLNSDDDIPDRAQQFRFTNPDDASTWIKLQGIDIWKPPATPGGDSDETDRREIWLDAYGYLICASTSTSSSRGPRQWTSGTAG